MRRVYERCPRAVGEASSNSSARSDAAKGARELPPLPLLLLLLLVDEQELGPQDNDEDELKIEELEREGARESPRS